MSGLRKTLICVATGFVFWLPGIVLHAIRGHHFGVHRFDIVGILVLPVVASALGLKILVRRVQVPFRHDTIALWMLLGIWMLGPLCTTIGSSFSGGGFTQPGGWLIVLLGIVLFAPLTFMMSAYDGTLGPLAVVTLWFGVLGVIGLSKRLRERRKAPVSFSSGNRTQDVR
jgi:hypothetical protein